MPLNEAQFHMLDEYVRGQLKDADQVCIELEMLSKKFGIQVPFYEDLVRHLQNVNDYHVCGDGGGWTYADAPVDLKFVRSSRSGSAALP